MDSPGLRRLLTALVILVVMACVVDAWSGPHVCTRRKCCYRRVRVCAYRWWWSCCRWRYITQGYSCTEKYCCHGWTHNGNQRCDIPVCNPPCQNGGTCISPGKCSCPVQFGGYRCTSAQCSHTAVCYPGICQANAGCDCNSGFSSIGSNKENYCLKIEDNALTVMDVYQMQVRLSYWSRSNPNMEGHMIMADSTNIKDDGANIFWTNRRDFNHLETTCASQYFPPDLEGKPPYINNTELGIVKGEVYVKLSKIPRSGTDRLYSLNKTIPCTQSVSNRNPDTDLYNCSITDPNFDRFLEHGDSLKVEFSTTGGGYREVLNRNYNPPRLHRTQIFEGVDRSKSVEFMFDFFPPTHCALENPPCSNSKSVLNVPDRTKVNPISIAWNGWTDADSSMYRYAWEVFRMTKILDNELEIKYSEALKPLINTEVLHADYTPQSFRLPGAGMYSVILEAADNANNTKFVRRLVLFDPDPKITTDPDHGFFVSSASNAANYSYQSDMNEITVTWDHHFRNALHEDNALLGAVRPYPQELRDKLRDNDFVYRKDILRNTTADDWEGERTVQEISNKRGIVKFHIHHVKDTTGGQDQPDNPPAWTDVGLNTTYSVPESPDEESTVTVWVKATDALGTESVEKTRVTFDSSRPKAGDLSFIMNVPVEGIDFSSKFQLTTEDSQSGIAHINWTFTRTSSGEVIYREQVPGTRVPMNCSVSFTSNQCRDQSRSKQYKDCEPASACSCTPAGDCFSQQQEFALSNCNMMVEKENLATEVINVTADITNMAGLVTTVYMLKDDLTKLNGTEAYNPMMQNITVITISSDSVSFRWTFPPSSCFPRTAVWVVVNGVKTPVHLDNNQFSLTGLNPGQHYSAFLVTQYKGVKQSDAAVFNFTTEVRRYADSGVGAGAIAGIIIGLLILILLVLIIIIFVLWRKGKVFQKEGTPINKQLHRMSRAVNNVRKTVRRAGDAFSNSAYQPEENQDEIYMYGAMTFNTRQNWQLDNNSLTLLDHLKDGRFATIYKAIWRHEKQEDNVAAKMLKTGFTEDDAMKMMAKINFFATKVERHDNVIKFLGAVTDNQGWGPVMVMELCEEGQMDQWLTRNRGQMNDRVMENLFQFSLGIAKGMEHLAKLQIVHKRLAARNILLTFTLVPKVSGFGPQQKEGDEDKATRVPAKWAAPEVLHDRPATEKSDVWSFGVVLWEIFSMGQVPYPNVHASEVGARLRSGYRMDKPEFADETYYGLMKDCWQYKPNKRPTFGTLRARLAQQFAGNRQSVEFYYDTDQLHN